MIKNIDTNFAYALLTVITVGFLLWHSIAIFNLEQDLKNLQVSVIPAQAGIQENPQNFQHVMPTEMEESQDAHILYNEDGSIDTSNWKEYQPVSVRIIYPPSWYYIKIDTYGSGFISTYFYDNADIYTQFKESEVRLAIFSNVYDIGYENANLDVALNDAVNYKMIEDTQIRKNVQCSSNAMHGDSTEKNYRIVNCSYDQNKNNQVISFMQKSLLIQDKKDIRIYDVVMMSTNKRSMSEDILAIIFNDFLTKILDSKN